MSTGVHRQRLGPTHETTIELFQLICSFKRSLKRLLTNDLRSIKERMMNTKAISHLFRRRMEIFQKYKNTLGS